MIDFVGQVEKTWWSVFREARKAVNHALLASAFEQKNYAMAEEAVNPALMKMRNASAIHFRPLAAEIFTAGAEYAAKQLNQSVLRLAKKSVGRNDRVSFLFDGKDPAALEWLRAYEFDLLDDLSETTINDLREIFHALFDQAIAYPDAVEQIDEAIGDRERAKLIARTESGRIANAGKREAWFQAEKDGFLTKTTRRGWVSHEEACPICQGLDGTTVPLRGQFVLEDGTRIDGPPAHPRCTCTESLVIQ